MARLNLGSNKKIRKGWINLDAQNLEGVDIVHDVTESPLPFDDGSIDEIYSSEFLEHIDFRMTRAVLAECYRVMRKGATMTISCPDIGKMCEYYANKQICECVKHKPKDIEDAKANPNCKKCGGRAVINPTRWRLAFLGAQKNRWDYHNNIIYWDYIRNILDEIGFKNITKKNDKYGWKLIVKCEK